MIRIVHYRIKVRDKKLRPSKPFRVLLISDMHNEIYRSDPEKLAALARDLKPEAVFSAGDLVQAKHGICSFSRTVKTLRLLRDICPIYAVNGNHETRMEELIRYEQSWKAYDRILRELGVEDLNNSCKRLTINDMPISLYGLELGMSYYKNTAVRLSVDYINRRLGEAGDGYRILLAHHPRFFKAYERWGADLVLSGHIHGGIIRLPGIGGVAAPDPEILPRFDRGRFYSKDEFGEGDSQMIVSGGLGTHTIKLRINNPADLPVLEFH